MAELGCQELVELVTEYLEGTLGRRERRRIAKHLDEVRKTAKIQKT